MSGLDLKELREQIDSIDRQMVELYLERMDRVLQIGAWKREQGLPVLDTERGTVVVREPRLEKFAITRIPGFRNLEPVFGPASYHGCDYSFFYLNLRENARMRAERWFAGKKP